MAIGWISVLQLVPWGDVITNAPKVAEAAKKLWNTVGKKPLGKEIAGAQGSASMQARLDSMEAQMGALYEQMLASSELIKALAEQNAQLVKRVEANRIRVLCLLVATVIAIALAITSLAIRH